MQVSKLSTDFDAYRFTLDGVEAWSARDLQKLLGYTEWRNFRYSIQRAMESCARAGRHPARHFVPVDGELHISPDRIFVGITKKSGRGRPGEEMILSRFAAYLTAMNGDPSKDQIAFAQVYFTVQTRKAELLESKIAETERLRARQQLTRTECALSDALIFRGISRAGFAVVRSRGDKALFGGLATRAMKQRLGCPENVPLANYLQTVLIRAKELAADMTAYNVDKQTLFGEIRIGTEHEENNLSVRGALLQRGIKPESVPAAENTTKVQQRHSKELKAIAKDDAGLPLLVKMH